MKRRPTGAPRFADSVFNMPFELGLDLGALVFGPGRLARKECLILEGEPYSFQKSLSDIAGQDIIPHGDSPDRVLAAVRNWLQGTSGRRTVPGTNRIRERFTAFADDLPELANAADINKNQLTFLDYAHLVEGWLAHSGMHSRSAKQRIGS